MLYNKYLNDIFYDDSCLLLLWELSCWMISFSNSLFPSYSTHFTFSRRSPNMICSVVLAHTAYCTYCVQYCVVMHRVLHIMSKSESVDRYSTSGWNQAASMKLGVKFFSVPNRGLLRPIPRSDEWIITSDHSLIMVGVGYFWAMRYCLSYIFDQIYQAIFSFIF